MAGRFHFSLEKILKLRESLENSRATELERSRQALDKEENTLSDMQNEKERHLKSKNRKNSRINLLDLSISEGYLETLNNGLDEQSKQVEKSRDKMNDDREKLTQASRDKKVMENLKDKRWQGYKRDLNKKELLLNSELALRMGSKQ